jgi:transketolase N-terminal domain/subunit
MLLLHFLQEMRQQMLRDIKILSEGHDVPGLLSFLGAYLVPEREQVRLLISCV